MKFWHSLPCVLPKFHFGTPMQVPANCLCQPVKPRRRTNTCGVVFHGVGINRVKKTSASASLFSGL
ncbi:MAG: hypothetical protein GY795_22175 [Desulfobacterales bacterium]|nr:hypothetical protein [Desulfobacterales bacterium]